ncbi:MAG: glycosyltransferase family 4 protein [Terracidiphilus sp.]
MRILVNEFCGHAFQMELSRELARRGHQVLHLYFADNDSTPKGETAAGADNVAGFAIEGLHVPMKFSKLSLRTRRQADLAYGKASAAKVAEFRPDIVLSANMPLDAQAILQGAAKEQGAGFIFWLQDVYSFAVRFVLRKKLGLLAVPAGAYYERLEKELLKRSDGVVCIAPRFAEIVAGWGVARSRIAVIENWAPLGEVRPTGKENAWACEQGVDGAFCFMYSGTLGMKHRPELLLALGEHLEKDGGAKLVVIAAGAGADWLGENAAAVDTDALKLLPFQPYKRLSEVMGASDVLIALLDSDAGAFAVPSKILTYLCAGRPLLLAAPKENHAAIVVERANAGIVVSPDRAKEFVEAAKSLMENAELRAMYAANGRAYAERMFDIGGIADRFLEMFLKSGNGAAALGELTIANGN